MQSSWVLSLLLSMVLWKTKKEEFLFGISWGYQDFFDQSIEARMGEVTLSICFKLYSVVYLDFHWNSIDDHLWWAPQLRPHKIMY